MKILAGIYLPQHGIASKIQKNCRTTPSLPRFQEPLSPVWGRQREATMQMWRLAARSKNYQLAQFLNYMHYAESILA